VSPLTRLVLVCSMLDLVVLGALPILWTCMGETHWLLILTRYAPGALYLPLPALLLALSGLCRQRRAALVNGVAMLLVVAVYMCPAFSLGT
jgi:hypothetical protein